ncbi:MAG: ATPase involved in chromosome partitioning [Firmicutes bacterium]|nr:ATPase involved in chromosome partitioning [Bacillota bacterium]
MFHSLYFNPCRSTALSDCGKEYQIFGESHIEEIAQKHKIDMTAKLPINPKLAAACDRGMIELYEGDWLDTLADRLEKL